MASDPDELFRTAVEELEEGTAHGDAIQLLSEVVRQKPDHAAAWYHLGYALVQSGDVAGGSQALERASSLREDPAVLFHLGFCRIEQGRHPEARALFERCLALGGPPSARYEIAWSLQSDGLIDEATEAARQYVLDARDDPDGWELYEALCRQSGRDKVFQRFLARHADRALTELLKGRDTFSMGGAPFPVPLEGLFEGPLDPKLEFLGGVGAGYLGAADDDGIEVGSRRRFRLGLQDAAVQLARLQGVLDHSALRVNRVVSLDGESEPLARAAGAVLSVPVYAQGDDAAHHPLPDGTSLVVQGIGRDFLTFRRACLALPPPIVTFVAAFDWFQAGLPFEALYVPDVCGVVALKVDWRDEDWQAPRATERLLHAFALVGDTERTHQRQYYRVQPGLRLRARREPLPR